MSEVVPIHAKRRQKRERTDDPLRTVQRGGRTLHVYGSGEDCKVFELPERKPSGTTPGDTPAA